eukprot:5912260-Pleurochrysis_carterae.AAC.1
MVMCMSPVFNTPPCDDVGEKRSICLCHKDACATKSGVTVCGAYKTTMASLHARQQWHRFRVPFKASV